MNKPIQPKGHQIADDKVNQQAIIFTKENKKRLLPDVFYIRYEAELVVALVAISVLILLPDWLDEHVKLFLSEYGTTMDTNWISIACNILLGLFVLYVIFRTAWLFFVRSGGTVASGKTRIALETDHLAEIIFSICIIILVIMLLVSMIEFLAILLENKIPDRMQSSGGIGP